MNREEFDKLYLGKAVHCDTEEKANEFLALAYSVGYEWNNNVEPIVFNIWNIHDKETCYEVTSDALMFGNINHFIQKIYQIVEYELQPKFKVGDRVRIKETPYIINGKVGVIEDLHSIRPTIYAAKIDGDNKWIWFLTENELEKVEEPTYEEETTDDIIEEIKGHQKSINVLLNRLERKINEK